MSNGVLIKIIGSGVKLILDSEIPFETLLAEIATKFSERSAFFKDKPIVIGFQNRELSTDEKLKIADAIMENSDVDIVTIEDEDPELEARVNALYQEQKNQSIQHVNEEVLSGGTGFTDFYKGNIRSGQVVESQESITIIGDVNPGAKVVSGGNIVILGALKGYAHAGAMGDQQCFIFALDMKPIQLQIGDLIAKSPDKEPVKRRFVKWDKNKDSGFESQIAMVQNGYICIEAMTKEMLNQL